MYVSTLYNIQRIIVILLITRYKTRSCYKSQSIDFTKFNVLINRKKPVTPYYHSSEQFHVYADKHAQAILYLKYI